MDKTISPTATRRAQVEAILTSRSETARYEEAQARARLREQLRRAEHAADQFRVNLRPVLDDYAALLSEQGLTTEICCPARDGEPPRLVLRVAERSGNGNGPANVVEGSLTFAAAVDLSFLSARQEIWRLLRGGSRQDAGTIPLDQLNSEWVEAIVLSFLRRLLLTEADTPSSSE